jgi:hypothetical protein
MDLEGGEVHGRRCQVKGVREKAGVRCQVSGVRDEGLGPELLNLKPDT